MDSIANNPATTYIDAAAATNTPNGVNAAATAESGGNIVGSLPGFIDGVQKNFIDPYTAIMKYFTDFMGRVSDLMTVIANATTAGNDSNHVYMNSTLISLTIDALVKDFSKLPLFTSQGTGAAGKAEAERWAKELGLDPVLVAPLDKEKDPNGTGQWRVQMDFLPLTKMQQALKFGNMTTVEYQAVQTAIDAQKQKLQSTVQTVAEKYGRANANIDSLYKMMSAMIVAMEQLMEAFNRTYAE